MYICAFNACTDRLSLVATKQRFGRKRHSGSSLLREETELVFGSVSPVCSCVCVHLCEGVWARLHVRLRVCVVEGCWTISMAFRFGTLKWVLKGRALSFLWILRVNTLANTHKRISLEHCCNDECLYISGSTFYRLLMWDKNTFSFALIFHNSLLVWNYSISFNTVWMTPLVHNMVFCICLSAIFIVQVFMPKLTAVEKMLFTAGSNKKQTRLAVKRCVQSG